MELSVTIGNTMPFEIGPGTSLKIPVALAKLFFSGKVYIVEDHAAAAKKIKSIYQKFLPKAEIHVITDSLLNSLSVLPIQPDLIVANHILDDLFVYHVLNNADIFTWSSVESGKVLEEKFIDMWDDIKIKNKK